MILKDTLNGDKLSNYNMETDPAYESSTPNKPPDCLRCRHFKITWEPAFPRACLLFGIKCRNLPSMEVFASTGSHCFAFQKRDV